MCCFQRVQTKQFLFLAGLQSLQCRESEGYRLQSSGHNKSKTSQSYAALFHQDAAYFIVRGQTFSVAQSFSLNSINGK